MTSIDCLFGRDFDRNKYQCAHFTKDAWEHLTGFDLTPALRGLLKPVKEKFVDIKQMRKYLKNVKKPVSPSVIFMFRRGISPHLGVYYNGRILHLTEVGVRYEQVSVATFGFKKVRYYVCQ